MAIMASIVCFGACTLYPEERPRTGVWSLQSANIQPEWFEDEQDVPFLLAGLTEDAPDAYMLPAMIAAGDQGPQASGTAWAAGYTATSYLVRKKNNSGQYVCSPAFIYNELNEKQNRGIEIYEALILLKNTGCPDMRYMPYKPMDYSTAPDRTAYNSAAAHRIQGFGRVEFFDLNQVKAHLLQGRVVIVTLRITENFLTLDQYVWEAPSGERRGRHTIALIGYDDVRNQFIFQNSAGAAWGQYGRGAIPYVWFVRMAQKAYVLW